MENLNQIIEVLKIEEQVTTELHTSSLFNQFAEVVPSGRKVTIVKIGEFGGAITIQTIIENIEPYSHYWNCPESMIGVRLIHKPKRKKSMYTTGISYNSDVLVYDGWIDIDTKKLLYTVEEKNGLIISAGKFLSFNSKNITTIVDAIEKQPIFKYIRYYYK